MCTQQHERENNVTCLWWCCCTAVLPAPLLEMLSVICACLLCYLIPPLHNGDVANLDAQMQNRAPPLRKVLCLYTVPLTC